MSQISSLSSVSSLLSSSSSQGSGGNQSQGQGPMTTPLRNKRVNQLQKEEGGKSPALKIPASPMMKRLGYGTGVGVYLMERSPASSGQIRSPWAIKKIASFKQNTGEKIYAARLEHEASILKKLNHPNIIGYRGFSSGPGVGDAGVYLALESASKSLADLIELRFDDMIQSQDMTPNPFPAKNIEKVGLDIAKALHYLHKEMKYIHGDLKSGNVLVFGDFEIIKLCDFGVARKLKEDGTVDGIYVGTEIWKPMEVKESYRDYRTESSFARVTHKADIYPYALTLFEMMSLKPPHVSTNLDDENEDLEASYVETGSDLSTGIGTSFSKESDYEEMLAERIGTRPSLPDVEFDESYMRILEVFYICTEEDPEKRPDAEVIVELLESPLDPKPRNLNVLDSTTQEEVQGELELTHENVDNEEEQDEKLEKSNNIESGKRKSEEAVQTEIEPKIPREEL